MDKETPGYSLGVVGTCCLMARKDVFLRIGEFDIQLPRAQDLDYALRAGKMGIGFIAVDKVLVRYFIHPGKDKKGKIIQSNLYLARKYKDYLVRHGMYFIF